jgi:hypothetical protein
MPCAAACSLAPIIFRIESAVFSASSKFLASRCSFSFWALLQSEWVVFCPEEPGDPCFSRGKAHSARFENLSRRLAWPGEQELLLLFKRFINNNIVLSRFTACHTSVTSTARPKTSIAMSRYRKKALRRIVWVDFRVLAAYR